MQTYDQWREKYDIEDSPAARFGYDFQEWLNRQLVDSEGVPAAGLFQVLYTVIARLRVLFTGPEMHAIIHHIMVGVEESLNDDDLYMDGDTGESLTMLTAEELRALGKDESDGVLYVPDTIPEGWDDATDQG